MSNTEASPQPTAFIKNSHLLKDLFGYWPSFHDAEISSFTLSVGCAKPWIPGCESPFLDIKLELCDWNGSSASTTVDMQFRSVSNVRVADFSYQNSVEEISLEIESRQLPDGRGGLAAPFKVICIEIAANCGMTAAFECKAAEVISAVVNKDAGDGTSS